jgi:hypothetical protein
MAGGASVYRVDKFIVPQAARDEFLKRVHDTHNILRQQPPPVAAKEPPRTYS